MAEEKFISLHKKPAPYDAELLIIMVEEIAEIIRELTDVQQRATKLLRFGAEEVQPGQELSNNERLADEIGDFEAIVMKLQQRGLINSHRVTTAMTKKFVKLDKFMQAEP